MSQNERFCDSHESSLDRTNGIAEPQPRSTLPPATAAANELEGQINRRQDALEWPRQATRDGVVEPNLVWKDTVLVRTGQTVDILFDVTNPGLWMVHCHIAEHMQSGMMFSFTVARQCLGNHTSPLIHPLAGAFATTVDRVACGL